jgi:hypothetical protein
VVLQNEVVEREVVLQNEVVAEREVGKGSNSRPRRKMWAF